MIKITITDPKGKHFSTIFEIEGDNITAINTAIGRIEYPKAFENFIEHLIDMKTEGYNIKVEKR